jgi:hypothetical protein
MKEGVTGRASRLLPFEASRVRLGANRTSISSSRTAGNSRLSHRSPSLRSQPVGQQRVSARIAPLAQLTQQHASRRCVLNWPMLELQSAQTNAVRRLETPAGQHAQVDWGHLGTLEVDGQERKLWGLNLHVGLQLSP